MFELLQGIDDRYRASNHLQQRLSAWRHTAQLDSKQVLEEFVVEKKRQRKRRSLQLKYLQNCKQQKISSGEELIEFYRIASELMQKQGLQVVLAEQLTSKEIKTKTVEMFVAFFNQVGNTLQAELIDRLCRKNVCSMECLIPTLVSWFYEWVRRRFDERIASALTELQKEVQLAEAKSPKPRPVPSCQRLKSIQPEQLQPQPIPQPQQQKASNAVQRQRRSMSPNRRVERSSDICKTLERESKDKKQDASRSEKPPPQMSKDYYFGVLNSGLVKLYRSYQTLLGLDSMFIKRYKKAKYDVRQTSNLVQLAVGEFQAQIKQSITAYAQQHQQRFSKPKPVQQTLGRRNANSMHSSFKSALKEARRPMKNRYVQQDRLPAHLLSDSTAELKEGGSSLLLQLPSIASQSSALQNNSLDIRNRPSPSDHRQQFLLSIYGKRNESDPLSSRRYLQLSKTIDKMNLQNEMDLLESAKGRLQNFRKQAQATDSPDSGHRTSHYLPRLPK